MKRRFGYYSILFVVSFLRSNAAQLKIRNYLTDVGINCSFYFSPSSIHRGERHRQEVEPLLFGKGKLDLTDPSETDGTEKPLDESDNHSETTSKSKEQSNGYGSIDTTPASPKNSLWTIPTPVSSRERDGDEDDVPKNDIWIEGNKKQADEEAGFHERPGRPTKPTRHCIVSMFYTIESFAMITNLTLLVSQVLPLIAISWDDADPEYLALKIYLCVFAIIFLFVEIDHPSIPFLRKASFLRTYVSRGFLYTFFGLVCFEEAGSEKAYAALEARAQNDSSVFRVSWFALVNQIAAISLISLGIFYFLMGIVCLQKVRTKYVYDDRQKWKAYREAVEKWDKGL